MPSIDVTDILMDGEIAGEAFQVQRRQETVNDYGESTTTVRTLDAIGSVVPTGDNSLVREAAFQVQAKTIRVITTFKLRGVAKDPLDRSYQPDVVIWKGGHYIVQFIDDYSQYGAGMVVAECTSKDLIDQPTTEPVN